MSTKRLAPLALLLAAPLGALASPSPASNEPGKMEGKTVKEAKAAGAKLDTRQCAFAPGKEGMKTGANGPIRVMLVDESGALRYLGTLEEAMPAAASTLHFQSDPVRGGT
ncbi:hypothetical protein FGE12_15385 [Aggregicoccus sp. 17bor-14]|uniref:hypothetical protein n=1 Tax=Myxococcaceae TaxID=31 RepID=UPI00129CC968|nr:MULTISPECIES: hypothetical protein [Myxococcaceae]MBF5043779.1 hypothetical protein [Simulacricoccus sp. 17bor-14]MRI89533.1 hypothetical protein [Aggregicoccus sp. 17bor-14]